MSAFRGKADVNHWVAECLLIAISGHPYACDGDRARSRLRKPERLYRHVPPRLRRAAGALPQGPVRAFSRKWAVPLRRQSGPRSPRLESPAFDPKADIQKKHMQSEEFDGKQAGNFLLPGSAGRQQNLGYEPRGTQDSDGSHPWRIGPYSVLSAPSNGVACSWPIVADNENPRSIIGFHPPSHRRERLYYRPRGARAARH